MVQWSQTKQSPDLFQTWSDEGCLQVFHVHTNKQTNKQTNFVTYSTWGPLSSLLKRRTEEGTSKGNFKLGEWSDKSNISRWCTAYCRLRSSSRAGQLTAADITQQHTDIQMTWWWVILIFYDLCGFNLSLLTLCINCRFFCIYNDNGSMHWQLIFLVSARFDFTSKWITRHTASTSMYSLTFCVRLMSPECHHCKPAVQAAAVMLRTPPIDGQSPASQAAPTCDIRRTILRTPPSPTGHWSASATRAHPA